MLHYSVEWKNLQTNSLISRLPLLLKYGKADFVSKLQIALKETNETSYGLLLLGKTNILSSAEYDRLETLCREIRITLIASINTTKQNLK